MRVKHFKFPSHQLLLHVCMTLVFIVSACNVEKEIIESNNMMQLSPSDDELIIVTTPVSIREAVANTPEAHPREEQSPMCGYECYKKHQELAWSFFNIDMAETKIVDVKEAAPKTYIVTKIPTPLYLIPLRTDFLLDVSKEVQVIEIPEGFRFQIANVKTISNPKFGVYKMALIANNYNTYQTWVAAIILEIEGIQGKTEFAEFGNDDESTVTFIATRDDIYFNKVINILTALKQISYNQEVHGAFQKDWEYSYLELIGLGSGELYNNYKDGLNKYLNPVRANGVCAIATGISMLLAAEGYESYQIKEKWTHKDLYHQSPYSFPRRMVDAAIEFGTEVYQRYDLKWIQKTEKYLVFNAHLFSTDLNTINNRSDGMSGQSEVGMIVSIRFSPTPINQVEFLDEEIKSLESFRQETDNTANDFSFNNHLVDYYSLSDPNIIGMVNNIYSISNLDDFKDILDENDSLKNILWLSDIINSYTEDTNTPLQSFLLESDWYSQYLENTHLLNVNPTQAIQKGTTIQIPGEPMQCVGFVIMLTDLYPTLGFPNVSGAVADVAGKLVPDFVYGLEGMFGTGYGEVALVGKSLTINDYNPGDFFVLKGYPGHVGAILAKKDNQLLIADSNRLWDGKVNIFVVNENNFDEVFGLEKYIVLGHQNSDGQ